MAPKLARAATTAKNQQRDLKAATAEAVAALRKLASKKVRDGMARYGLPNDKAFGVSVGEIQRVAKQIGKNHELALALWETGHYEARLLAAYVDEPGRVTPAQMDRWRGDFDNWGVVDTVCFVLFDRSPHAWGMVKKWAARRDEFGKRAAFALLACLGAHDKNATDEDFARHLPLIEAAATDERNFVKKGVSWALRVIGRRSLKLNAAAMKVAERLAQSASGSAKWIGKEAIREFNSSVVKRQLAKRPR